MFSFRRVVPDLHLHRMFRVAETNNLVFEGEVLEGGIEVVLHWLCLVNESPETVCGTDVHLILQKLVIPVESEERV